MKKKHIMRVSLVTAGILLIPLVAMQFTSEVDWSFFDFVFMGVLIMSCGLAFEYAMSRSDSVFYKLGGGLAAITAFLLVWVNAAVGIIGDDNPANLMYVAVPLVALVGAMVAGFKPGGMSRAMFAAAVVQALVPVIAFFIWTPSVVSWAPGVLQVFILNAFFIAFWAGSGILFRQADASL